MSGRPQPAALLLALILCACAGLPPVVPDPAAGDAVDPGRIYPQRSWQLLHALRASMPDGRDLGMLGLTVVSSTARSQHSVLMTLEGFVVFDGEYDQGRLTVHRALPPFDSPHFAAGLMEDIRLVFLAPEGPVIEAGRLQDGGEVRRVRTADGATVDIETLPGGDWRIRRYDPSGNLTRTVRGRHGRADRAGFPETIQLTAAGGQGYEIVMTLLEAVPIDG